MTGEGNELETSLRDDLDAGIEAGDEGTTQSTVTEGAPVVPAELPPLEAPEMWGKQYKEVFSKFGPDQREAAQAWLDQWKESQGYITRKEQEYADYRKRLDPVQAVYAPYEQYWAQQGMSTEMGLRQVLSYAEQLARDPGGTIVQLAGMYNVDLQQLFAEQPYVDPRHQALEQRLAQFEQAQQYQQQQQQQAFHARLGEEIRAFQTATDEQGKPKAPYFDRVYDTMLQLARGGAARNIQEAYERAVLLTPELQAEIAAETAKREAATRAAAANKAAGASRTVSSKSTTETQPDKSINAALADGLEALGIT